MSKQDLRSANSLPNLNTIKKALLDCINDEKVCFLCTHVVHFSNRQIIL